jgi:hypothetical protein
VTRAAEVFVNLLSVIEKDNPSVAGDDSGNCIIL